MMMSWRSEGEMLKLQGKEEGLPHHELNVLRKKDKGAKPIEAL
jgi:hypothetical protein